MKIGPFQNQLRPLAAGVRNTLSLLSELLGTNRKPAVKQQRAFSFISANALQSVCVLNQKHSVQCFIAYKSELVKQLDVLSFR